MKNLFTAVCIGITAFSFGQSIHFEEAGFKDILAKAKKENKLVFVDAYASWCGPCKLMEKNVFTDATVQDFYNAKFINAHFDMEKGEGTQLAQQYQVRSYPSFLFLNGDGELVHKGMGYMPAENFLELARQADNPFNKKGSIKEQFAKGERDPEFLKNALHVYAETDMDFAKKVSARYFEQKKDKAFSKEEVSMLLYFLKSTEDPNYAVFRDSRAEITKVLPEDIYNQFDTQLKLGGVTEKAADRQKGIINDAYFLSEAGKLVSPKEADDALKRLKMSFYPTVGNFNEYARAATGLYGNGEGFNSGELMTAAYIFSEKVNDPALLKNAVSWAEKAVMNDESLENTFILAKLYQKTGSKASAKMYAERALKLAEQKNLNPEPIQSLLNDLK